MSYLFMKSHSHLPNNMETVKVPVIWNSMVLILKAEHKAAVSPLLIHWSY